MERRSRRCSLCGVTGRTCGGAGCSTDLALGCRLPSPTVPRQVVTRAQPGTALPTWVRACGGLPWRGSVEGRDRQLQVYGGGCCSGAVLADIGPHGWRPGDGPPRGAPGHFPVGRLGEPRRRREPAGTHV